MSSALIALALFHIIPQLKGLLRIDLTFGLTGKTGYSLVHLQEGIVNESTIDSGIVGNQHKTIVNLSNMIPNFLTTDRSCGSKY